jgi:N-acetylmuramoyl-L-alanine amidase
MPAAAPTPTPAAAPTPTPAAAPTPTPAAPSTLTIIEKLETYGHEALTAAEHGAAWLVGECAKGETALTNLASTSPWITSAVAAGVAAATAHGIPVTAIEGLGSQILTLAMDLADGLAAPAPGVPATPPPPVAA